jgi:metal-responsive CopG/Arc/MetJ family transcriptional regulator
MSNGRKSWYTIGMSTTTKLSISLPKSLWARAAILSRPGEGRSAVIARLLDAAVRAAEEAEIDAEYERAYREHPIDSEERRVLDAFTRASVRSLTRAPGPRG